MFKIKICGITNLEDAQQVVLAGADAIGLNFFAGSSRKIDVDRAAEIANAISSQHGNSIQKIGLFVNHDPDQIIEIARHVGLDAVQLHGDEPPEILTKLAGLSVIKAIRIDPENGNSNCLAPAEKFIAEAQKIGPPLWAILLDAKVSGSFGGTGVALDWSAIAAQRKKAQRKKAQRKKLKGVPLILAGGLRPNNVASAIRAVRPEAVDTASGVESSPGHKDRELLKLFIAEARESLETS